MTCYPGQRYYLKMRAMTDVWNMNTTETAYEYEDIKHVYKIYNVATYKYYPVEFPNHTEAHEFVCKLIAQYPNEDIRSNTVLTWSERKTKKDCWEDGLA